MKLLKIKTVTLRRFSGWDRISYCRRNIIQQDAIVERFKIKHRVAELKFSNKAPVNSEISCGLINMKFDFLMRQGRACCLNQ